MATTKTQRWVIIVILAIMVAGTLGSFAVMILSSENYKKNQAEVQRAYEAYQQKQQQYQTKVNAQTKELSDKYYPIISQYSDRVAAFDRDSVTSLQTEDLLVGDGEEIKDDTKFAAYYIGWNPKGKVFDQSIDGEALKAPLSIEQGLSNASVITGWKEGLRGMRIGGVREITIPSDKAYGESGQGDDIPANTPLKFIVMAVSLPATIEAPDTTELMNLYSRLQQ